MIHAAGVGHRKGFLIMASALVIGNITVRLFLLRLFTGAKVFSCSIFIFNCIKWLIT